MSAGAYACAMSPLQKIAMGMVIVVGSALFPANPTPSWEQYDALPDPLGWLLVHPRDGRPRPRRRHLRHEPLAGRRWPGVVSVPMWFPQLHHQLDAVRRVVRLAAADRVLPGARPGDRRCSARPGVAGGRYVAKRFGLLVWGFAVVAVLPVLTHRRRPRAAGGADAGWSRRWSTWRSSTTCSGCTGASGSAARARWRSTRPRPQPETYEGRPPSSCERHGRLRTE